MEALNCFVAIGGSRDNTVPKYGISTVEAAVLRAIHGDDKVFDIEPAGEFKDADGNTVEGRDEIRRVREIYASPEGLRHVTALFPGMGAKAPEKIADLGFDESLFKAQERAKATDKPTAKAAAKAEAAASTRKGGADEDGVKDMPKGNVLE